MRLEEIAKKNNWLFKKISEVSFYQEGPGVRKKQYTEKGVKLLNVGNIQSGKIDLSLTDRYISEEEAYGKYRHFLADEGDLIIACSGIQVSYFHEKIGFIKKEHLPLCMNTSTMRFKSLDKTILNINYFSYFLKTNYFKKQLQRLITGSAQLNFGPSHIQQIDIILPPINIQKQIVEVLDEAQSLIDNRKEQINLLDDLIESIFYDMFGDPVRNDRGWSQVLLGDISINRDSERIPIKSSERIDGKYPYYGASGVIQYVSDYIFDEPLLLISEDGANLLSRVTKIAFSVFGKVWVNNHAHVLSFAKMEDRLFVEHLLNLINLEPYITGTAQPKLNQRNLNRIPILNPPRKFKCQFAQKVEQIESQKQLLQDSLKLLEDNYNSLMQRAFKGELF